MRSGIIPERSGSRATPVFAAFGFVFLWYAIAAKLHRLPIDFDHGMPMIGGIARDLRVVEGIFLFIVAAVVVHFGIELGKNVRGLALGMGIYVAVCIVVMALMVVFRPIDTKFGIFASGTYLLTCGIWMVRDVELCGRAGHSAGSSGRDGLRGYGAGNA